MQGVQINGAELGWPTMGLTMWVWLGEDIGSQCCPVPANCSGGLFLPAPRGPPRAAFSRAVLCYPTCIIKNSEGKSLVAEHLLGSEGPNPFVKGESALCYGAEPPLGEHQWFLPPFVGVSRKVRRAYFACSCAKRPPRRGNLVPSGGQAWNTAWRHCTRLALGAQSNQKSSCTSTRAGKSCSLSVQGEGSS